MQFALAIHLQPKADERKEKAMEYFEINCGSPFYHDIKVHVDVQSH